MDVSIQNMHEVIVILSWFDLHVNIDISIFIDYIKGKKNENNFNNRYT